MSKRNVRTEIEQKCNIFSFRGVNLIINLANAVINFDSKVVFFTFLFMN